MSLETPLKSLHTSLIPHLIVAVLSMISMIKIVRREPGNLELAVVIFKVLA